MHFLPMSSLSNKRAIKWCQRSVTFSTDSEAVASGSRFASVGCAVTAESFFAASNLASISE